MLIQFYRYLVINQRTGQIETLTRRCHQMKSESKKRIPKLGAKTVSLIMTLEERSAGFLLWAAKCPYKIVLRIHQVVVEVFQSPSKWWNDISIHRAMLLETNKHDMTATEVFYKQKGAKGHWSWELVPSIQLSF